MKTILASVALFFVGALAQNTFTINTPSNVVECQPTLLNWQGGLAPYYLSILPGASPNGNALESFPAVNSTSLTWVVNINSGTSIGFTLRDSTGAVAQTSSVTIQSGSSNSCLNSTSIVPGPTGASTSAAQTTDGATTAGASTTGATTGTSSAPSSSATAGNSGASANIAQFGAAGIVGAAVAALFI